MSTTIDDRVVEMRFDNSDFESNVSQTLSTLDKLKLALNLPGATKGLQDISAEAAKCDMGPLSKAVDNVSSKFSALDVIAFTALQNITNRVIDTGSRILREFTIEPISTGFSEYELKMGSVQTIMASTGESIDTVNKYLEELNKYSDQTIYSFSDMTNNIGKFTNAGVKLEDAVAAIKGVSNEAAVSGANANEASRAMYNFAQALSAGYVKLIDWKSIENANMATVEFKNELLKTAVACNTVADAGDGMYQVLTTNNKGSSMDDAIDATHNFNDSLSYQWMTTEVLTKTLARYADETTDLGKKAFAAAQDVKTFSMMMDTLKEAAQSGWAATWENIVGDFEEAKEVWTDFSEIFSNVIGSIDNARNSLLRGGLSSSWKQLTDQITGSGVAMDEFEDSLANVVNSHGGDYTQLILDNKNLAKAIQNGVIPGWQLAEAFHGIAAGAKKAKNELTGEAKYTKEQIEQITKLDKAMTKGYNSAGKLLRTLTQESGREYLFETLRNSLTGVIKLTSTFATAWRDIIPPLLTSERLYNGLKFIGEFSRRLVLSDDNADKLRRTLHGLFVPIDLVGKVIGKTGEMIFRVLSKAFGFTDKINFNILDYTAKLGDALTKFHDWVLDADRLGGYLAKVENKLSKGLDLVKGYIRAFWELPEVQSIVQKVQNRVSGFSENLEENLKGAASRFKNFSVSVYQYLKNYIDTLRNTPTVQDALLRLKGSLQTFIGGLPELYQEGVKRIQDFIEAVKAMNGLTLANVKSAIKMFAKSAEEYFINVFNSIKPLKSTIFEFIELVTGKFNKVGDKFEAAGNGLITYAKAVKDFVLEHKGALLAIAASAGMILFIRKLGKSLQALVQPLFDIGSFLNGVSGALNTVAKGLKKKLESEAIKNYAEALALLAGSLLILSKIPTGDLIKAVGAMAALAGVLVVLAFAMNKINSSSLSLSKNGFSAKGGGLLSVAGSIAILVGALKILDNLEHPENIAKNLVYIGILALGLIAVIKILNGGKGEIKQAKTTANAVSMLAIATSLKILVSSLDEIGSHDLKTIIKSLGLLLVCAVAMRLVLKTLDFMDWKAGLSAVGAAVSLIILVKAFKSIAELNVDKAKENLESFIMIFGLYAALMLASRLAGKNAMRGGIGILAMSASLITLAIAIRMLAGISASEMQKGVDAIKQIFAAFALVLAASFLAGKNAMRAGVMIGMMSGSLLLLTGAIFILSEIGKNNPQGLTRAIDAIKQLIEGYAMLVLASSFANQNANAVKAITIMTVAIGMLAIAIAGLSMIPEEQLNAAVKALSTVMIIFGLMTVLTRFSGGSVKSMSVLVVAIGMVALALYLLKDIDGRTALANATAISEVLLALSVAFSIVGRSTYISSDFTKELSAMLGALAIIALILGAMAYMKVEASIQTATSLSILLLALAGACKIIDKSDGISTRAYATLGIMLAIMGGIALILGVMDKFDVEPSIKTALAISILLEALASACLIVAIAGRVSANPATVTSAGQLLAMVSVIGGIMLAVAGLVSYIPGVQDFIDNGLSVLEQIAGGIGRIIRAFIGDSTNVSSLSDIGDELSGFMESLQPFLDSCKQLDASVLAGIGTLARVVAAVTTADMINGFRNLPIIKKLMGTGSLSEFGTELADFAEPLVTFVTTIKGASIKPADVEAVANAANCISEFASNVPNSGGKLAEFLGDNTLDEFGRQLVVFGPRLRIFLNCVKGVKASDADAASAAATTIAEFAKIVPNTGGLLGDLLGDNTLDEFGRQLQVFGPRFRYYLNSVRGIKASDADASSAAATTIAEFAKIVPNTGGFLEWLAGGNSLDKFGSELASFGPSLKTYLTNVKDIKAGDADASVAAARVISDFASIIPESGGLLSKIFGGATPLSQFGTELALFGGQFQHYYGSVKDIKSGPITTSVEAAQKIMAIGQGEAPDFSVYSELFKAIGTMGQNFKGFYENIKDIKAENLNAFVSLVRTVSSISTEIEGINIDSFSNFGNAISKLGEADLSSLSTDITAEIPNITKAIDGLMTALTTTLAGYSKKIREEFQAIISNMVSSITSKNSTMTKAGAQLMTQFIVGFSGNQTRLPRVMSDILSEILKTISSNNGRFKQAGLTSIQNFITGFNSGRSRVSSVTSTMMSSIMRGITMYNSRMNTSGRNLVTSFANGLSSNSNKAKNAFNGIVARLVSTANSYNPRMQSAGSTLMQNFISGLSSRASGITTIFSTKIYSALTTVRNYASSFNSAGESLMSNLKSGASGVNVSSTFTTPVGAALYSIRLYHDDYYDAGEYLVRGFANGISDYAYIARNAATALGKSTAKSLKNSVEEQSPSKLTYGYGMFFTQGFANGINEYASVAEKASEKLGSNSANALRDTLSNLGDMIDGGIDVEPTIRPVLDLSNVQSGLGQINGMLDANRTMSLGYSGIITGRLSDTTNAISQQEQLSLLRRMSNLMDTYFPQFNENDVYLDTGAIAGAVNRKLGLQS